MDQNTKIALEKFNKLLNKEPLKDEVSKERNGLSIAISILEGKLDNLFGAANWGIEVTQAFREINEFVTVVKLTYIHPVTGIQFSRSGIGAVPIQLNAGSKPSQVDQKKAQALQYNAPAAKSFAFKNAVKGLGKWFGRDLNRDENKGKVALPYNNMNLKAIMECTKAIETATSKEDIAGIFFNPAFDLVLSDPLMMNELISKKTAIKTPLKAITDGK